MEREGTRRIGQVIGAAVAARAPALERPQALALREAWQACWSSRALVWAAGVLAVLSFGRAPDTVKFDPGGLTEPFGGFGDLLVAPAARWDAVWYLGIAHDGYGDAGQEAFFPLYPFLARAAGLPFASVLIGGVLVSMASLLIALYLMHRLATLELGPAYARPAVLLVAFFPTAFFFSAVYSEALFLALSVGAVYAARRGNWAWAGAVGALAAATRSAGVLVAVPIVLLYLYGPRGDRPGAALARGWRPRYAVGRDLAWVALVPLGLAVYLGYLQLATGDPTAPFRAQEVWFRHFAGPFAGAWDGAVATFEGARQLLSGSRAPVYFTPAAGDPFAVAGHNLVDFAFLGFAAVATVGVLRRLPVAYGAYVVAALALPLSYPVRPEPLMSLPRFVAVLFPLHMWLAVWSTERRASERALASSAVLLGLFTAQFATWRWVA